MTQSRKKRRLHASAEIVAEVANDLKLPEVAEALAGEALAQEREVAARAQEAAEQEALIAATQETDEALDNAFQLKRTVESMLFASDRPLTTADFRQYLGANIVRADLQASLDALVNDYQDRGIVLHDVAGGYQFRTHSASSQWIQKLIAGRPVRLSRAQLDTLAIVAYRQPITRPEIDEIRGVDSGSTLKILLDRSLIRIMGKKEEVGRPLLYGTTKDFLEFFNLSELRDLPTLREFHELNDEGMAEVDKLGADIKGVDVGAVAAQVAMEREAIESAEAEAAEALIAEKKAAKEAAKAEKLAAARGPEASADDAPEDSALSSGDPGVEQESRDEEMLASSALEQESTEDEPMTQASDEQELGGDDEEESTRVDTEPAPSVDPDTIMETHPGASFVDSPMVDMTLVDRKPIAEDLGEVGEQDSDFAEGSEQTMDEISVDEISVDETMVEPEFDPDLTAPDSFVPDRPVDGSTVSSSDSSE